MRGALEYEQWPELVTVRIDCQHAGNGRFFFAACFDAVLFPVDILRASTKRQMENEPPFRTYELKSIWWFVPARFSSIHRTVSYTFSVYEYSKIIQKLRREVPAFSQWYMCDTSTWLSMSFLVNHLNVEMRTSKL